MTSKCFSTFHWLYIRCLCHSESALVPIPKERVCLQPQNAEKPAVKPQNGETLGYK